MKNNRLEELGIGTLLVILIYTHLMPIAGLMVMAFAGKSIVAFIAGIIMFVGGFAVWLIQGVTLGNSLKKDAVAVKQ